MRIKLGDIIIIILIAALAVLLIFIFRPSDSGDISAVIMKGNEQIEEIDLSSLDDEQIILVETDVKIAAQNGRIRFIESSCLDKTCINTGWLTRVGDTAACLPNRVLIKIVGNEDYDKTRDVDMVAE